MAERSVEGLADTEFTMAHVVFPSQVNHYGTLFGGYALQWMDQAAWICATRFARKMMVTIASDRMEFKRPVPASAIVLLNARIIKVGRTSVTVQVEMQAERPLTGERFLATQGQFVMVAVDENGRPTPVKA
ncbi:MAG TPA: acyl-CoA thioesterase [Acidobacteriota bacterium]|nr:acyl-CoA thioesterase [Acidobacteriota bacterium]